MDIRKALKLFYKAMDESELELDKKKIQRRDMDGCWPSKEDIVG